MSRPKTRLGIIGAGLMAQLAHLPSFVAVPDAEIVALATHRPEVGAALAARYGIPQVYPDYRDLIANPDLDAVVCIQPYHQHFALGQAVLSTGKALFTEKPMVTRYDHGQQLVELAERQGVVYGVGFMKRYDPGVQLARERLAAIIGSGELGRLRLVEAHCYLGDWLQGAGAPVTANAPAYGPNEHCYPDHIDAALAPAFDFLLEVYCHNLNLVRYLLPDEQLVCLSAVMADPQTWALTLASREVLVSLRGAWSAAHDWDEATTFVFERGRVTVRTQAPMQRQAVAALTVYAHGGAGAVSVERHLHPPQIEWAFARQARAFVAAVRGEAAFAAPGRDSLRDLALIEHIFHIVQRLTPPTLP